MSSTLSATDWLEHLSPWPKEFGLERMQALVRELGDPQRAYPSIHVVGTNGKGTATREIEELLTEEGLSVGAYFSPHVRSWSERIRVNGAEADFDRAIDRVRERAGRATQFEVLTAAALVEFREQNVDVAVIEAGLGGRWDATNVVGARVVHLTNVSLDHTDVLGETREEIAREKLAVAGPGAIVVLGEPEWARLVPGREVRFGGARETAEAFLGRPVERAVEVALPGRLEWRGPGEVWDGAHNPAGLDWQAERIPDRDWIVVASILADKDVDSMLERLAGRGRTRTLVATRSSNPRSFDEKDLARRAERYFDRVEAVPNPHEALRRARLLGPVLVTGSFYLLADLSRDE
ncbi:MAG TPA: Mur ligase family protein [Gaiellaceae bacterium]|nr:Mur ligase family protein [Gaiellaceae bacterium]